MRLPVISGRDAVKAFIRLGWTPARQHGSHLILTRADRKEILTVPIHHELRPGTLRALLRAARLTVAEFVDVL